MDTDGDGDIDPRDNCRTIPNPDQNDTDLDTLGDACDNDDDEDYVLDAEDNCPLTFNPRPAADQPQPDGDGDGIGTACDPSESQVGPPAPTPAPGSTATPPPAAAAADRTPPALRLAVARRQAFGELGGGLVAAIRCSEACRVSATLRLGARQARTLRLKRVRTVARGSASLADAGRTYAFLRFDPRARARLWRARRVTATLRVAAVDAAGNRSTLSRKLTLHR